MSLLNIQSDEKLAAPVLLVSLAGWVDAAAVGTTAAAHVADDGEVFATFDTDALIDYRSNRPVLDIVDGRLSHLAWPELAVKRRTVGGRDILVMSGSEPDIRWKEFAASVVDLALRVGVTELVSLGGVPAAVPHTFPPPVLSTASKPEILKEKDRLPEGLLRVPGAAVNVIDLAMVEAGIPTVGFWAQVPHYVSGPYFAGSIALLEKLAGHLQLELELDPLREEAVGQREHIDGLVAARDEAKEYVDRLETLAAEQEVPSGEDMAIEIERFLRDRERGQDPFSD